MSANVEIVRLAFRELSLKDRAGLLDELTGKTAEAPPERLLRRAEVAARLSCSLRLVDLLAVQGNLTRVKLPGRQRSNGFLQSEVERLLAGEVGGDAR